MLIDNTFIADDFLLGMLAGAFGAIGVGLLYRGSVTGANGGSRTDHRCDLGSGARRLGGDHRRASLLACLGRRCSGIRRNLVGLEHRPRGASDQVSPQVIVEALLAGAGFGMFFIVLDETNTISAPWPIVGARLLSSTILIAWLVSRRIPILPPTRSGRGLIALTGLFDTGSNVLFLYALRAGDLTTVAVLTALYPISTVVLARIVLHERMTINQLLGFVSALGATVLIAAG